jgi:Fibronectin type III domain
MKNKIAGTLQIGFNTPNVQPSGTVHTPESGQRTLDICWSEETAHEVELTHLNGRTGSLRRIKTAALILFAAVLIHLPVLAVQSVSLTWDASSDTNAIGYNIYYWEANGGSTNEIFVSDVTDTTVSNLADGATYQFAATAVDAAGDESAFSNLASFSVASVATISMHTVANQGITTAINITASGAIPAQWALESSPDLVTWTIIASGTNSNISVSVPVTGLPSQFFRLKGE